MTAPIVNAPIIAFADLDDTLFQTLRKLPHTDPATLRAATVNTAGQPHSYMTAAQAALLDWLEASRVPIIPVTGRDSAAFARVGLTFSSWRVLDHGLTILDAQGQPEADWAARVTGALEPLQDELHRLSGWVRPQVAAAGGRLTLHQAHGVPFMAVIKHPEADAAILARLQDAWADAALGTPGLRVIANANNVSLLPAELGKAAAVSYLKERYFPQVTLTLGIGDSISDLGFMAECDFAVTPQRGQLMRALLGAELQQR